MNKELYSGGLAARVEDREIGVLGFAIWQRRAYSAIDRQLGKNNCGL